MKLLGIVDLTEQEVITLHEFITGAEYLDRVKPVLEKFRRAFQDKAGRIVPKDMESVYEIGVLRGRVAQLDFEMEELRTALANARRHIDR